ncbi:hypothetical protein BGZ60DRAFT_390495 [Tricladium varicosporioides]|nr:hypothetical protein BGZ60DRAFT_390495 [Hymenoscyphus varicosporioides]
MWRDFIQVPKTLIITSILASTVLLLVIISSLTIHTPGSYIHLHTVAQKNSLQPHYDDPDGPMELGGTHRCGSYPSQAKALGCVFDIINFGWTAPECYHQGISKAHLAKGPWRWFLDGNSTIEVPQEYINLGHAVEVWTTRDYQLEKCRWLEDIIEQAKSAGNMLVPRVVVSREYVEDCVEVGKSTGNPLAGSVTIRTRVIYNSCVKLSEVDKTVLYYEQ